MSVSESRRSTFPGRVAFQPHRRLHAMCARGTSIVVMVQQNVSRAIHIPRQCIPGGGTRQGPGVGGWGWSQKAFCRERTSFKWTFLQDDPWAGKVEGGIFQNHSPVSTIELLLDGLPWFLGSR